MKKPVRIAAAAATTSSAGNRPGLGQAIEAAMAEAVNQCFAEGVTDDDPVREAKLAARERVKREYAEAEAEAARLAAEAAAEG